MPARRPITLHRGVYRGSTGATMLGVVDGSSDVIADSGMLIGTAGDASPIQRGRSSICRRQHRTRQPLSKWR